MKLLNLKWGGGKMSFTYLFYKHIILRKSCEKCHFTNLHRPSDITIADFWGWQKTDPNINSDDKGVSLVLINTEKGRKLFEASKERMNTVQADIQNCLQPNMQHPTKIDRKRNEFERDYQAKGFDFVYKKYGEDGWRYKVDKIQIRIISSFKNLAKKIIDRK